MDKKAKPLPNNTEIVLKLEVAGKDYALAGTIEKRQHLFTAANRTIEYLNKYRSIPPTVIGEITESPFYSKTQVNSNLS